MATPSTSGAPPEDTLYSLAHREITLGNYRDAATLLRLMLHLAPDDERSWLALGLCHEREGQPGVARELYSAGTVAAAPSGRCALAAARVCLALCKQDEAVEHYESALTAFEALGENELHEIACAELRLLHVH